MVIFFDEQKCRLNILYTLVKIPLYRQKKPMFRERGQNAQQRRFNVQLTGQAVRRQAAVFRDPFKDAHDIRKCVAQRQECRMRRRDTAGKEQLPVLDRFHQTDLGLIVGIQSQNTG